MSEVRVALEKILGLAPGATMSVDRLNAVFREAWREDCDLLERMVSQDGDEIYDHLMEWDMSKGNDATKEAIAESIGIAVPRARLCLDLLMKEGRVRTTDDVHFEAVPK